MAGLTFDLLVLSSSPPKSSGAASNTSPPSNQQRVHMTAYSPIPLSPLGSPRNKASGALKSGSRAAPVPEDARKGFATAGSLVKSHHFSLQPDDEFVRPQHLQSRRNSLQDSETTDKAPKKPRKRATKPATGGHGEEPKQKKPRARKPKTNKDEHMHDAATRIPAPTTSSYFANPTSTDAIVRASEPAPPAAKAKPTKPRKPRAKKTEAENGETQTKLKKAKITKPRGATKSTEKPQRTDASLVSSHFNTDKGGEDGTPAIGTERGIEMRNDQDGDMSIWEVPESPRREKSALEQQPPDDRNQALDLDEAVTRRRDWTPPKDTRAREVFTSSAGKENDTSIFHIEKGTFTNMLSNFAYAHTDSQPATTANPATLEGTGGMKRRRVELVNIPGNQTTSRNTSPEKGKAPKKKPRTITDLVTGQYASKDAIVDAPVANDFISPPPTTTMKVPLNDMSAPSAAKPIRKRSTSKPASEKRENQAKPKSRKASAKTAAKPKMVANKLLSPASAVMRMNKQEILFGTSSQLALEESPTMIREIQRAIRESEHDADALPGIGLFSDGGSASRIWSRLEKVEGKRALWAASSRGEGGQLLEKLEDVFIPEPDRTQDLPLLMDGTYDNPDTSFADIDDFQNLPIQISSDSPIPSPVLPKDGKEFVRDEAVSDASFEDIDNFAQGPPSNQKAESSFFDIDDFSASPPPPAALPACKHPPEIIASTGSPKKRRGRPPKSHPAVQQKPKRTLSKDPPSKVKMPTPALPSTPPKKKSRFADIEEILDSEDDEALSPTPPRTSRLQDSPPLSLVPSIPALQPSHAKDDTEIVQVYQVPASLLGWENVKHEIFKKITSVIRNLPPSTNPSRPSWHEKILLYDPIILEDFTAFLNASTGIHAYKRATQKQIKAWNKGLKARGDAMLAEVDGEEVVNVVNKELEAWMVQGWCQEMSICCITKEGRVRGGMGKGLY